MATKFFKNKGVLGFTTAIAEGMWCGVKNVMACVIAVLVSLWKLAMLITSPLWFPLMIVCNPERAAQGLTDKRSSFGLRHDWLDWWLTNIHNWLIYYLMRWLWTPVIVLLPMKLRGEFIFNSPKPLYDYSVRTQVRYYKTFCEEGKRNLIAHGSLSEEARAKIWEDENERVNWVSSERKLTNAQIEELLSGGTSSLLRSYFKRNTPDKDMRNLLIRYAHKGFANAMGVLLDLIKRERPNAEFIGRLLDVQISEFQRQVNEIIDQYADLDAVTFAITPLPGGAGDMSDREKASILRRHWLNFCKGKGRISEAAQKKMNYDQYRDFVATSHKLSYQALKSLCLTVQDAGYLQKILETEFKQVDEKIITALKSEYWRYSIYLAVKQDRNKKA